MEQMTFEMVTVVVVKASQLMLEPAEREALVRLMADAIVAVDHAHKGEDNDDIMES